MYKFFDRVNNAQAYKQLLADPRDYVKIAAFGVQPNEKPFIAANAEQFALYVTADYVEAQRVFRAMQAVSVGKVVYVPSKEDVLLYKRSASLNATYARNLALHQILHGADAAVVCVDALMQLYPLRNQFFADSFTIKQGVSYDTKKLVQKLVKNGFARVDGISGEGEFVVRGDILELSLPFEQRYRVDFFDDEVESIRSVNSEGVADAEVNSVEIYPLYETCGLPVDKLAEMTKYIRRLKLSSDAMSRLNQIVSELTATGCERVDNAWLAPFCMHSPLFDYLPVDTLVFYDEPKELTTRTNFLYKEHAERVANLTKAGEVLPLHEKALRSQSDVFECEFPQIALQTLSYATDWFKPQVIRNFKTGAVPNYTRGLDNLARDIRNWLPSGYEIIILAGADGVKPTQEELGKLGCYVVEVDRLAKNQADGLILPIGIEHGFVSHANKLVVIGARDIGRGLKQQSLRKNKKQAFLSVEKGDYVVHDVHGIGLCEGVQKITNSVGEQKDYVVVLYKNGDRLYVPVDAANMLSRYSGGENPTLSKLGGEDFARVKSKVKSGIREMSVNLLKLYAEREKARGFRYNIDEYLQEEFQQYFPYKATEDQLRCHEEIVKDLTSNRIMDRVLVGDVGYGKTEVAMRAAFDVVANGYQVAVLAPTTILAEQHFKTFSERMAPFDVKVACLNRFRTAEQQQIILKDIALGNIDVIIGTHRLLSKDVVFNRLGLLVLDEEQRFGVEHKEKLKALKTNVDVLTMSATPIPRTLHMALSGIRDISTITTPPIERMAVDTFVVEESEALIVDVITRELARGGQVYCVYNRVQSIDRFAANLADMLPNAKIVVAHGQMSEIALEDTVTAFAGGQGDVLVCTTIIENGIDIPNVNTLIVIDADKLGLSQLYQLRGRVGRSNRPAYAYFTYADGKVLSEVAYKRLSSILQYSELGSGFKIAMKDLEIRGAGNILGREQHGHMIKVGYDMYARLLKETVDELKGEKPVERINTEIAIDIEAYAPETFMPLQGDRISFYQQLATCATLDEIDAVKLQIVDVYGVIPRQVDNLFKVAELKLLANNAGICKVTVKTGKGELTFANRAKMMCKKVFEALSDSGDRVTVANDSYSIVFASTDFIQKERLMTAIKEFLLKIQP